ncbi:MAG: ABC transporter ATP-binding protein [Leptospira sp.]|nr:ABC transporter ATP-binding protein [Leptospira sp.]
MNKSKVECRSLTKVYKSWLNWSSKKNVSAVNGVSFSIKEGEVYSILGPNGAGKSTIIKMIAGLITPTSGEILIDGKETRRGASGAFHSLSAILEGPRNVYWRLSPLENLHYFGNLRGIPSRVIEERADDLLKKLEIDGKKRNQSQHLSRGMLQKLALAVALITDPKVLLLDEPTLGLDVSSARKIKEIIKSKAYDDKKAILLTTHQMGLVEEMADRIAIVKEGKIVAEGTPRELKQIFSHDVYKIKIRDTIAGKKFKLPQIAGMKDVQNEDGAIGFRFTSKQHTDIYPCLDKLKKMKAEIIQVSRDSEDLEEIFLKITGRT